MSQDRVFLLNPQNAPVLTEGYQHPHPRNDIVAIVMVMISLAVSVLAVLFATTTILNWTRLNEEGITVEGYLTDRVSSTSRSTVGTGSRTSTTYYWRYRYTTEDGQRLTGEVQVEREAYDDYQFNAPVQVLYLADDPNISRIVRDSTIDFPRLQVIGGALVFGLSALSVFIFAQAFNQRRHYRANGKLIYGKVDTAKLVADESNGKRKAKLYINYEFTSPTTGKQLIKFVGQQRDELQEGDLPAKGTPVAIFYANDRIFKIL